MKIYHSSLSIVFDTENPNLMEFTNVDPVKLVPLHTVIGEKSVFEFLHEHFKAIYPVAHIIFLFIGSAHYYLIKEN